MLILFFFHQNSIHYVTLTSNWQPKISRLSGDSSLNRMISIKYKALFPSRGFPSFDICSQQQVIYTDIYNYKTLLAHSPRKEIKKQNQELSHLLKDLNKEKLTFTEGCFHGSNAKVTPSSQILLKAYNKLSKTTNL